MRDWEANVPKCRQEGPCFARRGDYCMILTEGYEKDCPFQKENIDDRGRYVNSTEMDG